MKTFEIGPITYIVPDPESETQMRWLRDHGLNPDDVLAEPIMVNYDGRYLFNVPLRNDQGKHYVVNGQLAIRTVFVTPTRPFPD